MLCFLILYEERQRARQIDKETKGQLEKKRQIDKGKRDKETIRILNTK